jgi:hypothetical protein
MVREASATSMVQHVFLRGPLLPCPARRKRSLYCNGEPSLGKRSGILRMPQNAQLLVSRSRLAKNFNHFGLNLEKRSRSQPL